MKALQTQRLFRSCRFNAENLPSPLFLTDKASKSYFWKSLAKPIRHSLVDKPYAMENHKNGVLMFIYKGWQSYDCMKSRPCHNT